MLVQRPEVGVGQTTVGSGVGARHPLKVYGVTDTSRTEVQGGSLEC